MMRRTLFPGWLVPLALASAVAAFATAPWVAPTAAVTLENPIDNDEPNLLAGERGYFAKCVMCHGETGRGDGVSSSYLQVPPGDLSDPAVHSQSDGALYWKITKGRRPMPGFGRKLSDTERWQIVQFIRTLVVHPEPAPGDADAEPADEDGDPQPR